MPEIDPPTPSTMDLVRASLSAVAEILREGHPLDASTRNELAALVDELAGTLSEDLPSESAEHLAESAVHLVGSMHEPGATGGGAAKARLEDLVAKAEVETPMATGVARRLVDLLSNIGI